MEVLASLTLSCLGSVSKTNLSVHEDKNRVPFVKVSAGRGKQAGPGRGACGRRRRGGHGPEAGGRTAWAEGESGARAKALS